MFRGQYEHTMDGKGRISVPARYREVLAANDPTGDHADRLILTRTFEQCLVVYPMDKWLAFEEKVRALPQFNPSVQQLKRVYIAGAVECSIDSHGRLLVPQAMRDFAQLDRECVWVGQLDTVELWSRAKWDGAVEDALEDPQALSAAMSELGL
ncbi:division/cell wall cluster transcriptional repressor MraZ [Bradymonadaceae bacterium TMQ3]|uniref:Transcriptional regulator MraZ n=1 Tax=Lujinxingia sediminis TaxID=2480984 RepID=A0ABY0CY20_9DELT|nr:division/cell wall cluster transcriptional repressor MraZ [Lujinxingia sediminis]RDV39349.1 division/cell wall cluster transcriptional repressor MraZ [Bradymonadaceae bacterium TMQ3]RVU48614.1 division/cell wall cluster transcriptional repressor MraZ [Lujinxingia sediminis]TXC77907.1 division/cell wall cluster transcriptional repressor MraZ [Bradymonadales bacterium TMQ1]